MLNFNWVSIFTGVAALVVVAVGGTRPAIAVEVLFGDIKPSSGLGTAPKCTNAAGDEGYVCSNG
jgi:hypothetical protein